MITNINKNISKLIYLVVFTFFCFQEAIVVQDSQSYIDNIYKRPFLYPFIINIFQIINENNFLKYLSIFQILFGYIATTYFSYFFIKKFKIDSIYLQLILILPVAYPFLGVSMRLGSAIMSESIAYSLFLIFSIYLIKSYIFVKKEKEKSKFFFLLITFILLVLIKKTFLILLPLIVFIKIIDLIINKNVRKFFYNLIFLIIALITTNLLEKTNTYFKSGVFKGISVSGSSLLTAPFYLATDIDLKSVKGKENQKIIEFAIKAFEIKKKDRNLINLSNGNILEFSKNNRKIFSNYFNQYVWMQDLFENKIAIADFYNLSEEDQVLAKNLSSKYCKDIAIQLFKMRPKENIIFYLTNVGHGMGGYFISRDDLRGFYANIGFSGFYLLIFQILIFFTCLFFILVKKRNNELPLIVVLFISLNLGNVFSIALYQPVYDRFSFFSFQMIFFISILVFINSFQNQKNLNK